MFKINNMPIIIQPIDNIERDLDWKLVFAAENAKNGMSTIICHAAVLNFFIEKSNKAIWLGRFPTASGTTLSDSKLLELCKYSNINFLFLPDEGAFYFIEEYLCAVLLKNAMHAVNKNCVKNILFWGSYQKQICEQNFSEHKNKYIVTGMPRFDLCENEYSWIDESDVAQIKKIFNNFILINTRCGSFNTAKKRSNGLSKRALELKKERSKTVKNAYDKMFDVWSMQGRTLIELILLTKELALTYPNVNIIIRPHPAERLEIYRNAFENFSNIYVIRDGDVRKWIRASKIVIQSDCTTGLESLLVGKPTINFIPNDIKNSSLRVKGLDQSGIQANSISEALEIIECIFNNKFKNIPFTKEIASMVNNINEQSIPIIKNILYKYSIQENNSSISFSPTDIKNFSEKKSITQDFIPKEIMRFWCTINNKMKSSAKIKSISSKHIVIIPN